MNIVLIKAIVAMFFFVIGAVMGSFMLCMCERYTNGKKLLSMDKSECEFCHHKLSWINMIPILGFILRKGKCKYCNKKIGNKYIYSELLAAFSYLMIFICYGISLETAMYIFVFSMLFCASIIDIKTMEIPNAFFVMIIVFRVAFVIAFGLSKSEIVNMLAGAIIIPAALIFISYVFKRLKKCEMIGGGDIKLFFAIGMYLGIMGSIFNMLLSCLIGLVYARLSKVKKMRAFPFAPSISAASMISLMFGNYVVDLYFKMF